MDYLLIVYGIIGGVLGGMGMGGGTLLIPLLTILGGLTQIESQGINLISFCVMAIFSLIIHAKNKLLNYKIALIIILSGIGFSFIGSFLANSLNMLTLKKLFGIFLTALGLFQAGSYFIFDEKKDNFSKKNDG